MRFIVDLFRYVIFAFCALAIIGTVTLVLLVLTSNADITSNRLVLLGGAGALVFLILNLGGIAILFSLHDRHAELVDELSRVANQMSTTAEDQRS